MMKKECFKYITLASFHHNEINNNHGRINCLQHFAYQYHWKKNIFPKKSKNWDKFEKI